MFERAYSASSEIWLGLWMSHRGASEYYVSITEFYNLTYIFSAYNESNGFSLGENDQLYRYLLITDASNKPKVKHQNYDQNYEKYCNLL